MNKVDTTRNIQRAESARERLALDMKKMIKTGEALVDQGEQVLRKGVLALAGIGLLALAVGVAAARRRSRTLSRWHLPDRSPSFAQEALKGLALSILGVVARRLAQQLPLPVLGAGEGSGAVEAQRRSGTEELRQPTV